MAYLLDANTLIEAKNTWYAFDLCPGFWSWIEDAHNSGQVFSTAGIRKELLNGNDQLAAWAKQRPAGFFLPDDAASLAEMPNVSTWVTSQNFQPDAIRQFMSGADPFLVAYAKAHGHTVVTHERHQPGQRNRVKIPTVCAALGVACDHTFTVLRAENVRFVVAGTP